MAKTRQQKELTVKQLTEKLKDMKALVFSSFAGLSVKDATDLRKELRSSELFHTVTKRSLLKRALQELDLDDSIVEHIQGGLAVTIGYADEVAPAKLLHDFAKNHPAVVLQGGIINSVWVDAPGVAALAQLPGRDELIAKTVWTIKAPLSGLANVLAGNLRGLITVLKVLHDKQPA